MDEISIFLLVSYLMMASVYTFVSLIDKDKVKKYWYVAPFVFYWCLTICWFYFPINLGYKLSKK